MRQSAERVKMRGDWTGNVSTAGEITRQAARKIGEWPGWSKHARAVALAGGTVRGSDSFRHAEQVWSACARSAVLECVREKSAAQAELAMVGALASHLGACERCWRTGPYDSRTPAQWVMWGVARRPGIAGVVGPVLRDVAGARLDQGLRSLG